MAGKFPFDVRRIHCKRRLSRIGHGHLLQHRLPLVANGDTCVSSSFSRPASWWSRVHPSCTFRTSFVLRTESHTWYVRDSFRSPCPSFRSILWSLDCTAVACPCHEAFPHDPPVHTFVRLRFACAAWRRARGYDPEEGTWIRGR